MKIQILNYNNEKCTIRETNFFRDLFYYFDRMFEAELIEWTGEKSNILAVTDTDLGNYHSFDWADINIVFAETCQRIFEYHYKLDLTKAYIFVTESAIDFEILKKKFYGLPLLGHYTVFNEVFQYGTNLFTVKTPLTLFEPSSEPPPHDYFCLIGRKTSNRERFIYKLAKQDLSNCLVKYNGEIIGNSGAPMKFDFFNYREGFFLAPDQDSGGMVPSKAVQSSLYNNFRAEIQFETDAYGASGWDMPDYHLTEKTIKPLIMKKPCMIYGPAGYMNWLSTFGIDIGHGNFKFSYDKIEDHSGRMDAMLEEIKSVDWSSVEPDPEQHIKNLGGFHELCNMSKRNALRLYHRIRSL